MGEFAEYALGEILDEDELWDRGELPLLEDGYPAAHPFARCLPGSFHYARALQEIPSGEYDGFAIEVVS